MPKFVKGMLCPLVDVYGHAQAFQQALSLLIHFFPPDGFMNSHSYSVCPLSCPASGGHPGAQGPGEGVHVVPLPPHPGPAPPALRRHRRYARHQLTPSSPCSGRGFRGPTNLLLFLPSLHSFPCAGSASAVEMVALLVQTGLFDSALTLCRIFKLSLTPIFEGLTYK